MKLLSDIKGRWLLMLCITLSSLCATFVFSIYDSLLLHSYVYQHSERIARPAFVSSSGRQGYLSVTPAFARSMHGSPSVGEVMLSQQLDEQASVNSVVIQLHVVKLTSNAFEFLAVPPQRGTYFSSGQSREVLYSSAVLSDKAWHQLFDANPAAIGTSLRLGTTQYRIIGVMPPRFTWDEGQVYVAFTSADEQTATAPVYVRVANALPMSILEDELTRLARVFVLQEDHVALSPALRIRLVAIRDLAFPDLQIHLRWVITAGIFLLLIALINVGILLLLSHQRDRHMHAIRVALGESRNDVIRRATIRELIPTTLSAGAGGLLAALLLKAVPRLIDQGVVPVEAYFSMPVWAFALPAASFVFLAIAMVRISMRRFLSLPPSLMLKAGVLTQGTERRHARYGLLLFLQAALLSAMLLTALIQVNAFVHTFRSSFGFTRRNVLVVRMRFPENASRNHAARVELLHSVTSSMRSLSSVSDVGYSSSVPPFGSFEMDFSVQGEVRDGPGKVKVTFIDESFLSTLQIPLAVGRSFTKDEVMKSAPVALVNESFANRVLTGSRVVGSAMVLPGLELGYPGILRPKEIHRTVQITGVVKDFRNDSLNLTVEPEILLPASLLFNTSEWIFIRFRPGAALNDPRITDMLQHTQAAYSAEQYVAFLERAGLLRGRSVALINSVYSFLAVLLAMSGLYSIISFIISLRARDLAIRMSLGSTRARAVQDVVWRELMFVYAGTAVGLCLASFMYTRFGTQLGNSRELIVFALLVFGCIFLSSLAASVQPMARIFALKLSELLRSE